MKTEHPIIFSSPMVRSILSGCKTQTRRKIKPQPWAVSTKEKVDEDFCSPYTVGMKLWVRETWRIDAWDERDGTVALDYKAGNFYKREWLRVPDPDYFFELWRQSTDDMVKAGLKTDDDDKFILTPREASTRWRPSIHLPRWAARITLEVTGVRVEKLQDITDADAQAEGVELEQGDIRYVDGFIRLWESIHGPKSWEFNSWVWVVTFKLTKCLRGCKIKIL